MSTPVGEGPAAAGAAATIETSRSVAVVRGVGLHGALDVLFAALYAWLGFVIVPGRAPAWNAALGSVIALLAAAGVALLVRWRLARPLAMAAQVVLLLFSASTIVLLVASAAYLRGIYGPIGRGLAWVALVAAALVVELCGLLPIFQLRFLLRSDVKRLLGRSSR